MLDGPPQLEALTRPAAQVYTVTPISWLLDALLVAVGAFTASWWFVP